MLHLRNHQDKKVIVDPLDIVSIEHYTHTSYPGVQTRVITTRSTIMVKLAIDQVESLWKEARRNPSESEVLDKIEEHLNESRLDRARMLTLLKDFNKQLTDLIHEWELPQ